MSKQRNVRVSKQYLQELAGRSIVPFEIALDFEKHLHQATEMIGLPSGYVIDLLVTPWKEPTNKSLSAVVSSAKDCPAVWTEPVTPGGGISRVNFLFAEIVKFHNQHFALHGLSHMYHAVHQISRDDAVSIAYMGISSQIANRLSIT